MQKKKSCKFLDKEFIDDMHWEKRAALCRCQQSSLCECLCAFVRNSFIRLPYSVIWHRLPNDYFILISLFCDCKMLPMLLLLLLQKGCQALANEINHIYLKLINFISCLSGVAIQMNWMDCISHIRYLYFVNCVTVTIGPLKCLLLCAHHTFYFILFVNKF